MSFAINENFERVRERLLECLKYVLDYCLSHGLALNCEKTHGLVIEMPKIAEKLKKKCKQSRWSLMVIL